MNVAQSVTVCSCFPPLSGTCTVSTVKTEEEAARLLPVSLPPLVTVAACGSHGSAEWTGLHVENCSQTYRPVSSVTIRVRGFISPHRRALWSCESAWMVLLCSGVQRRLQTNSLTAQLYTYSCDCSCKTSNLKSRIIKKMCFYSRDVCLTARDGRNIQETDDLRIYQLIIFSC